MCLTEFMLLKAMNHVSVLFVIAINFLKEISDFRRKYGMAIMV